MEREVAIRTDGMIINIGASMNCLLHFIRANMPNEQFMRYRRDVGQSMAALHEISRSLYSEFPDIVPKELQPSLPSTSQEPGD